MSENILVVEYEPRYTDRVRQALAGQPFNATFAKDGDEAIRALQSDAGRPKLIVLSSVVPKISTTELITAIRGRFPLEQTPILLTVSGYNGKSPKEDARRVGASDILPKPYSETEFLGKVQQMLGVVSAAQPPRPAANPPQADPAGEARPTKRPSTSRATDDVDKMLADTLAGVMPQRKKEAAPATPVRPKAPSSGSDLDRLLQDTLSGLDAKNRKAPDAPKPVPGPVPQATPAVAEHAQEARPQPRTASPTLEPQPEQITRPAVVADPPAPAGPAAVAADVAPPSAPPKVEDDEVVDGIRFGQYVLVEKIATGGMAEVWKAKMRGVEGFQKIVAIKKILPHLSDNQEFVEMFIDEAKLAAQLNHNNIIHIYDLGKIQSSYYIAMEYIDGFDLKTILRRAEERGQPMSVELALFIASKIASALDYAHRKKDFESRELGLVHRDVSPQNVLISDEGDIKLCDFGIAKAASKASHTQAGALKGKLQYMAPEQAWGRTIDRRSDIFSLGTVLFEMLTARKLFTGDSELSILDQVREAKITAPSLHNEEVSPAIDAIVIKALQKDPADRYQTAGEMARELDAILYNLRPTPTSADLAIYMHHLASSEHVPEAPAVDADAFSAPAVPAPVVSTAPAVTAAATSPLVAEPAVVGAPVITSPAASASPSLADQEPPKKKLGLIAGVAAAALIIAVGAVFVLMRPAPKTQQAAINTASAVPVATPAPAPTEGAGTDVEATDALTGTAGDVDSALVDQEVQKLLAAERARLEAQARAQQQAQQQPPAQPQTQTTAPSAPPATATTAATTPASPPQQVAEQVATNTAPAETRPAPPVQQPPAEVAQAPAPESRPAASQQARAQEGDLVPAGTAGLTPARIIRRGSVPYPPMARAQRVEGTVLTNVLVSETGQVLDVRIVRGINRPVGLNEAAEQTMRRSQFAPGMKDGVRVKSWLTVPVEFKL